MKRLSFICLSLLVLPGISTADSDDTLWYTSPASEWSEGLPIGNGRIGGMVFGSVPVERIQLNEESLWAGQQFEVYPDNFLYHLNVVRDLLNEGKPVEANEYGLKNLVKRPSGFRSYEPLGDLYVKLDHGSSVEDYRRELDMETGIVTISYSIGDVRFVREIFTSAVDDILIVRLTSSAPNAISANISLQRHKDAVVQAVGNRMLHMDGQIVDDDSPDAYDDNPGGSGPGGKNMRFSGRLLVDSHGGKSMSRNDSIQVSKADAVTILFTAATDYNLETMNFDRSIDPAKLAEALIDNARAQSVLSIRDRHVFEHAEMYNRVSINLGGLDKLALPTDERLAMMIDGSEDPAFIAQLFQFGRYLLMSSSRAPGRLPANLQGIWNKEEWAPWEADYHLNINLQMNYWSTEVANLFETHGPFISWFERVTKRGEVTARTLYDADGWLMYLSSNAFGKTSPDGSQLWSQFINGVLDPLCGAWMTEAIWRHFEFTNDKEYLRDQAYPILKGSAEFIMDTVVENSEGQLVISPSTSPENSYILPSTGEPIRITIGSTYHNVVTREVLATTLRSAQILDVDQDFQKELQAVLGRIPPTKIGADGTVMEWPEDYAEAEPEHRHLSHLLGLYPFAQITPADKALFGAARETVVQKIERGGGTNGWGRAWMVGFFARLLNGNEAHHHLNAFIRENLFSNMTGYFAPVEGGAPVYQIDASLATPACIAELFIQSHVYQPDTGYEINLLPALPDAWKDGSISGLRARGGHTVDISWKDGELSQVVIYSAKDGDIPIKYGNNQTLLRAEAGQSYKLDNGLNLL